MPMTPFMERLREVGARETRSVTVPPGQDLPEGEYGFLELYCNERGCDCRRVTILVLRPETGWSKIWATIGYGWDSLDFYREWGGAHSDPVEMKGPGLDPFNVQTGYSPELLNVFQLVLESPGYIDRLKRHYQMFRNSVEKEGVRGALEANRIENKRRSLRDPKRRRRSR
jgi:hypothetical protein